MAIQPCRATQGYGYKFWRCQHGAYRASGLFGQYCIVMPEQNAVLAITSGIDVFDADQLLNLTWTHLLPAMQPHPLLNHAEDQNTLAQKLSNLGLSPVQRQARSPISRKISGRTHRVDANDLGIETITFDFGESGCTVHLTTAADDWTIPCGHDVWENSHTTLFNGRLTAALMPVATSGAWTADETFTMVVRLHQTPFYYMLVFHFFEDELMLEVRANVTLESPDPLLMTARAA